MKKYLQTNHIQKLKELRLWADANTPEKIKPALDYTWNYALGWLAPEMLGTGFKITKDTDPAMLAELPFYKSSANAEKEIHQGVVVNVGLEMIRQYLDRRLVGISYKILESNVSLKKRTAWANDLQLKLSVDPIQFEAAVIHLKKKSQQEFEFDILISATEIKKTDRLKTDNLKITLLIEKIHLLT